MTCIILFLLIKSQSLNEVLTAVTISVLKRSYKPITSLEYVMINIRLTSVTLIVVNVYMHLRLIWRGCPCNQRSLRKV